MKDVKIIELEAKGKKTIKMLDYNRPINRSLVNKLKESMKKLYWLMVSIAGSLPVN